MTITLQHLWLILSRRRHKKELRKTDQKGQRPPKKSARAIVWCHLTYHEQHLFIGCISCVCYNSRSHRQPPAAAPLGHNCGSHRSHCGYWWLQESLPQPSHAIQYRDTDKMCNSNMGIHDKIALTKSPCVISCLNQCRVYAKRRTIRGMKWSDRICACCGWIRWNQRDWWHND